MYLNGKVKKEHRVELIEFMPHEDRPKPLTFEEERMRAHRKRESL